MARGECCGVLPGYKSHGNVSLSPQGWEMLCPRRAGSCQAVFQNTSAVAVLEGADPILQAAGLRILASTGIPSLQEAPACSDTAPSLAPCSTSTDSQLLTAVTKHFIPQSPGRGNGPSASHDTPTSLWSLHQLKTQSSLMASRPFSGPGTHHTAGALPSKSRVLILAPLPLERPPPSEPAGPHILSPVGHCFFLLSITTQPSPMIESA